MANRVLLDANGLRISKPGFNAINTGYQNLIFTSEFSAFGIVNTGLHTVSIGTPANEGSNTQTISFGQTFPTPPMVAFEHMVDGVARKVGSIGSFRFRKGGRIWLQQANGSYQLSGVRRYYEIVAEPTTTGITVQSSWSGFPASWTSMAVPDITFRWTLFTYNY